MWTSGTGEVWYCHGDDDESPTCYERNDSLQRFIEDEALAAEQAEDWTGDSWQWLGMQR